MLPLAIEMVAVVFNPRLGLASPTGTSVSHWLPGPRSTAVT
jgi:hypothetical protein